MRKNVFYLSLVLLVLMLAASAAIADELFVGGYREIILYEGMNETVQLEIGDYPVSDAAWTSENKRVATVSSDGLVTAVSQGVTKVTAKANGIRYSCKIRVNPITYRALLIGNDYKEAWQLPERVNGRVYFYNVMPTTIYDLGFMKTTLSSFGGTPYEITRAKNLSSVRFEGRLKTVFADADRNDVSLIFFSGHASSNGSLFANDGEEIGAMWLRQVLDRIPGKKVLLINGVYNDGLINAVETNGFEAAFIDAFRNSEDYNIIAGCVDSEEAAELVRFKELRLKALTLYRGTHSLLSGRDKVLYSISEDGSFYRDWNVYGGVGVLTQQMFQGLGYEFNNKAMLNRIRKTTLYADSNEDNGVSMSELAEYMRDKVEIQTYFADPDRAFFKRTK